MDCSRPSRRQALLWASLGAAMPLTGACEATSTSAPASNILATGLEVVTVTDTSVVITWFTGSATAVDQYGSPVLRPVATDTELKLGSVDPATQTVVPGSLKTVLHDATPTPYHYAEVSDLEPGTTYAYAALSSGQAARQTSMQFPVGVGGSLDYPGVFTTLTTPPGSYLFTLALSNDLHVGEAESGIIADGWPPHFEQNPGLPPYPVVMLEAMLGDLRRPDRRADRLIVAGDLTAGALPAEVARVRQMLDGWGKLQTDYFVARGNHDRSRVGSAYKSCATVPSAPDHRDCWRGMFPYPLQQLQVYEVGGLRLIGLDTTTLDAPGGTMDANQLGALSDVLQKDSHRPTMLFGHHPVTYESAATTAAGPSFDIDRPTAVALQRLYERSPGVFFHHSGHTHRNKRTFMLDQDQSPIQSIEFLEVGATKEYPGGYSLLRLYTGGYIVSYYKNRTNLALAWSQRTRGEYYNLYAHSMLGTIADRNHSVTRDLSGLTPSAKVSGAG
jgi:hypothetical protein